MHISTSASLLAYNTFGIDAVADYLVSYQSVEELQHFLKSELAQTEPLLAVGAGSNLLFLNSFKGVVLTSDIKTIRQIESDSDDNAVLVEAGAGVVWNDFVRYCVNHHFFGVENLAYIPGTVGASAIQNIGAYGVEAKEVIHTVHAVEVATGKVCTLFADELDYGYRTSKFKKEWKNRYIITSVVYKLTTNAVVNLDYKELRERIAPQIEDLKQHPKELLHTIFNTVVSIRKEKLPEPHEWGNGGSFFLNPVVEKTFFETLQAAFPTIPHYPLPHNKVKIPAAWLIEQCGWKGKTVGKAGCYEKQPLVLINCGGATGADIAALAEAIVKEVQATFHITLIPEVSYIS